VVKNNSKSQLQVGCALVHAVPDAGINSKVWETANMLTSH
jgi:hypothetical protein